MKKDEGKLKIVGKGAVLLMWVMGWWAEHKVTEHVTGGVLCCHVLVNIQNTCVSFMVLLLPPHSTWEVSSICYGGHPHTHCHDSTMNILPSLLMTYLPTSSSITGLILILMCSPFTLLILQLIGSGFLLP